MRSFPDTRTQASANCTLTMEVRSEPMRNAYTYASILSAVGRVLDEAGVKRFAIQPLEDGLLVEGFDDKSATPRTWRYDIPALHALVAPEARPIARTSHDEGTLRHFLEQRELVGAR